MISCVNRVLCIIKRLANLENYRLIKFNEAIEVFRKEKYKESKNVKLFKLIVIAFIISQLIAIVVNGIIYKPTVFTYIFSCITNIIFSISSYINFKCSDNNNFYKKIYMNLNNSIIDINNDRMDDFYKENKELSDSYKELLKYAKQQEESINCLYHLIDMERTLSNGNKHYWKQNLYGYTINKDEAGTFTYADACKKANEDFNRNTVMVPVK